MQVYKLTVPFLGIISAAALLAYPAPVSANWFGGDASDLVTTLSQKLGIGQDKVQSALDSIRSDRTAAREKNYEEYLTQLVNDKKITEAQKQLLIAKHKEIQDQKQKLMDSMQQHRTDTLNWAKQNNIDPQYLMGFGKKGGMRGMGMRHWR